MVLSPKDQIIGCILELRGSGLGAAIHSLKLFCIASYNVVIVIVRKVFDRLPAHEGKLCLGFLELLFNPKSCA